jgi:hypothetical protein
MWINTTRLGCHSCGAISICQCPTGSMSCSLPHYDLWASLQYPILSKAFTLHLQYSGTQKLNMKYTQVYMIEHGEWQGAELEWDSPEKFLTCLLYWIRANLMLLIFILPFRRYSASELSFKCMWPAHRTLWGIANGLKSS